MKAGSRELDQYCSSHPPVSGGLTMNMEKNANLKQIRIILSHTAPN